MPLVEGSVGMDFACWSFGSGEKGAAAARSSSCPGNGIQKHRFAKFEYTPYKGSCVACEVAIPNSACV